MKPSEELMLLLELNKFDVLKFKLKKQLEFEQSGNEQLYRNKKLADLLISNYTYVDDQDYLHRNPLMYKEHWGKEGISIDQFYVKHPDLEDNVTLQDVLLSNEFDDVHKESILYDILDGWVEDYRESSIVRMENLREMVRLMPKKSKKYKKPSRLAFFMALIFALVLMFVYMSPSTLSIPIFPFIGNLINNFVPYLYDVWWYAILGNIAIYMLIFYVVANSFFRRYMKDIRSEKNKHAEKTFDKWDQDMKNKRLEQAGVLEDYVNLVIKKPKKSQLDVSTLTAPELLMDKLKNYVMMIERKYDMMTKYYKTYRRILRLWFVLSILCTAAFYLVGFALVRGWIGV